ncbi:ABC transporter ATP-binding protein [Paenibacillus pinihumi]|uniref:ABC transporter ATP-binding protein n=1 Tax=Paenibacillus pinihumi TaxID=669462 RepID=UPI000408202C|nr:ABC transporter ATP-binding protein [Paenibacillus pinihumi]
MKNEHVIEVNDVTKSYGKVHAVQGISLSVNKGEVYGVIGPKGAGKSTLLEMLMGVRKADGGSINVLGLDVVQEEETLKHKIGIQLQATSLFDRVKVKEALKQFHSYYNKTRCLDEIIGMFSLEPYLNKYVRKLSGGLQQRTALAIALVNDPEIIFLDEPTAGLEPQARAELWDIVELMKEEGKTIVVSTHDMEEVETHCDRVAVVVEGKLFASGTPDELIAQLPGGNGTMEDVYLQMAVFQNGVSA